MNGRPMRALVAGAGGTLGRLMVAELQRRGCAVRAIVRKRRPANERLSDDVREVQALAPNAWRGVCDGVDVVLSSLGASVAPKPFVGWRPYTRVDAPANLALLEEATRAGVRRFVYVSLIGGDTSRHLDYSEGHERVVDALRVSPLAAKVLRPTGFFAAMTAIVDFARRGPVPVIGDGHWPTNPVDERDLAELAVAEALTEDPSYRETEIGGPETFTRREIAELAFAALGRRPRLLHVPAAVMRASGHALRVANPRAGHFVLFATHVMTHDCLATPRGERRLRDAFDEHVRCR